VRSHTRRKHSRRRRHVRRPRYQLHPTVARYKQIQQALKDKGYYHGKIDGYWGPNSVSALQRFQTEQGIENEGKITALALIGLGLGPKHAHAITPHPPANAEKDEPQESMLKSAERP
jgi:peptidoglycan hydrolase-like protein with peptidoglycan-binding domain